MKKSTRELMLSHQRSVTVSEARAHVFLIVSISVLAGYFFDALGGDESLVRQLLRAHITTALFAGDEVYYAEIPGQGVVGVSVWFGPGQMFLNSYISCPFFCDQF
jgi:hypothetical protein